MENIDKKSNRKKRRMEVGVVDDHFIWAFGGVDVKVFDVIEMCDIKTGEWKTLDDISTCLFKSSCCE